MTVATVSDLMARIVVNSADSASTPDLYGGIQQSFVRLCWLFYDPYVVATSNDSWIKSIVIAFLTSSCDLLFVLLT
ncbi:hypothetical protein TNCV_4652161 [Trichonephila clavipes]|nr:hypothetical protein TNCV_4652161 [Trichonephila clavipes]